MLKNKKFPFTSTTDVFENRKNSDKPEGKKFLEDELLLEKVKEDGQAPADLSDVIVKEGTIQPYSKKILFEKRKNIEELYAE